MPTFTFQVEDTTFELSASGIPGPSGTGGPGGAVDSVDGLTGAVDLSSRYDALGSAASQIAALNLGSAATHSTTDYATAAQGTKADNAVPTSRTLAALDLTANRSASDLKTALSITEGDVTNLTTDLAAKVPNSRTLAGLDLTANRTAAALKSALAIANTDVSGLGTLSTKSAIASADITDGTIVDADISSSAAIQASKITGLKYAPQCLYISGQYVAQQLFVVNSTITNNRLHIVPHFPHESPTVSLGISINANTAGTGSVAHFGIWPISGGLPATGLIDMGTIALNPSGTPIVAGMYASSTTTTLVAGTPVYFGVVFQLTSGSATVAFGQPLIPVPATDNSTQANSKFENSITGSLPDPMVPSATTNTSPVMIYVKPV